MANMMQFGDFSPLDVLATAASLQSARRDSDSDGERGGESGHGGDDQEAPSEESADKDEDIKNQTLKTSKESNSMVKDTQPPKLVIEGSSDAGTDLESSGFITDLSSPVSDSLGSPFSEGEVFTPPPPVTPLNSKPMTKSSGLEKLKPACVVKLLDGNGSKVIPGDGKTSVTLKDTTKIVLPTKQGSKTMTVIKINKQQVSDHSYAFLCQLQKLKSDEDEGYSSRSSVESEGEGDCHSGAPAGMAPVRTTRGSLPQTVTISGKKQPKILIVGKDKNLQKIISTTDSKQFLSDLSAGTQGGSIVLRTLLGQKSLSNTTSANGKHAPVSIVKVSSKLDENSAGSENPVDSSSEKDQNLIEANRVSEASVSLLNEQKVEDADILDSSDNLLVVNKSTDDCLSDELHNSETSCVTNGSTLDTSVTESKDCVTDKVTDCRPADAVCVAGDETELDSDTPTKSVPVDSLEEKETDFTDNSVSKPIAEDSQTPLVSVEDCKDGDDEVTISVMIPGRASTGNLPVDLDETECPVVNTPSSNKENCVPENKECCNSKNVDDHANAQSDPPNSSSINVDRQLSTSHELDSPIVPSANVSVCEEPDPKKKKVPTATLR